MTPSPFARWFWTLVYRRLLLPLILVLSRLWALRNAKVREALQGHRGVFRRLEAAMAARAPGAPLLWFHVASAGEFLQAQPVLERFLADGVPCALTVTSPSGLHWVAARRDRLPGLLVLDYLPPDTAGNARRLLALLHPTALIYTKYDLWPNLLWAAQGAGVPQFLLSATLHPRSWRVRTGVARSFYRTLYGPLAGIYTVTDGDAARFRETVPAHPGIATLGDTRFDSVLQRRDRADPPALPAGFAPGTALVVGSSWPADEAHVFPVLREALAEEAALRLILVPHEVDAAHLSAIEAAFAGLPLRRLSAVGPATAAPPAADAPAAVRIVLVDTVGQLAALYRYAAVAYVGGAFTTGVHNVLEPAAMGAVPLFGPYHENSPEAVALCAEGLAFAIRDRDTFRAALRPLLADPARRAALGARARTFVESRGGATTRTHAHLRAALGSALPPPPTAPAGAEER